jgi:MOSC domain-containing protein YiiM
MKLLSVNVSLPKEVSYRGKTVRTGIYKEPVEGRVRLRELNLDGDGQADLVGHGGIYKAVHVYTMENYDHWKRELNRDDLPYGQFGENFTVEGMPDDKIHVGDVFRVGSTLLEVTQPRVPCFKLAMKMEMPDFLKLFMPSERVGFYSRVLEEGEVGAGDSIERVKEDPEGMTVKEMFHLLYYERDKVEGARRALCIAAMSPGWRGSFEAIVSAAPEGASRSVECSSGL